MSVEEDKVIASGFKNEVETEAIPRTNGHSTEATEGHELIINYANEKVTAVVTALSGAAAKLIELQTEMAATRQELEQNSGAVLATADGMAGLRDRMVKLFATSANEGATSALADLELAGNSISEGRDEFDTSAEEVKKAMEAVNTALASIKTAVNHTQQIQSPLEEAASTLARGSATFDQGSLQLEAVVGDLETYIGTA